MNVSRWRPCVWSLHLCYTTIRIISKSKVCWSIFLFFSFFFALDGFPECWSSASVPAGGATEIKVLCAKILGQSVPYVTVACTLHLFIFLPPAQQHAKSCSSDFILIDCLKFSTFVVFCTRLVTVMLQKWLLISCLLNPHTPFCICEMMKWQ